MTTKYKFGGKIKLRMLIRLLKDSGWQFDTLENYSDSKPELYVKKINPKEQQKIVLLKKTKIKEGALKEDKERL